MKKYKVTISNQNNAPQIFGICEHEDHIELGAYLSHDINAVDIPTEISGKPVTVIGSGCFFAHEEISSVTFPETLTSTGEGSFAMCKGIRELVLPDSVTEIGSYAFRDCTGLRKIVLPKGLKTLRHGVFAFTYLPADADIIFNEGLEKIESHIFYSGGVNSHLALKIPESVRECAPDAFDPGVKIIR